MVDIEYMAEAIEEELERRARKGKTGKLQVWAPSFDLWAKPASYK